MSKKRLRVVGVVVLTAIATIGVSSAAPGAAPGGGIDPGTVELTLGPGQSASVAKRVTTPAVAPKPDIVILGDTTGSMDPVIANVRNNIGNIMDRVRESQPEAQFAITAYKDQVDGNNVFKVFTPLTPDEAAVRAGMENMSHDVIGGGAPWVDYINAHYRIATDAIAFRPGSTRMIAWFGDAASRDPSLGHTLADANAALRAAGVRVIAVPIVGTSGDGLDRLGQATSITTATAGRLLPNSTSEQVSDALLAGIQTIDVTVTPRVTSCDVPLTVGFDAPSRTVRSGTDANFTETFQVRPDAPAGTYHCSVDFLVNGVTQGFVQNITVHVPGLSVGDVSVTEGDSGTTLATFPVTLDRPATGPVTVHVATADGTAVAPGDYTTISVDVPFAAGELSKSVSVPVAGDRVDEPDETFTMALSAAGGAAIARGQGIGTIVDNDPGGTEPAVSVSDVRVVETNSGSSQAIFTISLDRAATAEVSVRAATADGTAMAADGDYAPASETISFGAGQTSRTFAVNVNGDTKFEPDETFTVGLSAPVGVTIADNQGVGTISNDDTDVRPRVAVNDVSIAEGNSGTTQATFTISLDQAPTQGDVGVHWATANGTASAPGDFVAASGDEVFSGSQTSKTVTVTINGDTTFEPDETYTIDLSAVTNADLLDPQGVGTIVNDDPAGRPHVSVDDVTVTEGDSGSTSATFTIGLDQVPGGSTVEVDWATVDGTATMADNDFAAGGGHLTFTGNETSRQVTVNVTGDTTVEPDETFTVQLSNAVNADLSDPQGIGTIRNDDEVPSRLSVSDVTLREGNSGTSQAMFAVTLDRPSTRRVTVHAATVSGTASSADNDFTAVNRDLVFEPGAVTSSFPVDVIGDLKFEGDETFAVELSGATNAELLDPQGVGTIVNDDSDVRPRLTVSDVTLVEGNVGTTQATFTISLDRAPSQGSVGVHWSTGDGTASSADNDFVAASGDEVFSGNETSRTVSVTINGDTRVEPDETFTVDLSSATNADLLDPQGVGTVINDDGNPPRRLSIGDTSVFEGDSGTTRATFAITLNVAPTADPVRVHWTTGDGTATAADGDYNPVSGDETFAVGQASKEVTVNLNGDTRIEPDETFTVTLSAAVGAELGDGQGVGTILNDDRDGEPVNPKLAIGDVTVTEGDNGLSRATFTVTLDRAPTGAVSVHYATADGTAVAPGDYLAAGGDLRFTGSTSQQVTVDVVGDQLREATETFSVALSGAAGASIADGIGVGTIVDNDPTGDRGGVFSCRATALNQVSSTANPATVPCRDDAVSTSLANVNLGLLSIRGSGLIASTDQTPDDLAATPAAAGDNATAHAELAALRIRLLAVTIEVGMITSTAVARCVAGPAGLTPAFSGTSTIAALKINGVTVPVGSGPIRIPLLIGSLELNTTELTATSITQRAFALNTLLGRIVIGETTAGTRANPGSPNGTPCRR
jgi:ribosomal protein L35AE/L33A